MVFIVPFAAGVVVGYVLKWGLDRSQQGHTMGWLNRELVGHSAVPAEAMAALDAPAGPTEQDRLERIHGIGKVYSRRLNEAGIWTFADLAQMDPEAIRSIVESEGTEHMINPEDWIAQAREFAGLNAPDYAQPEPAG